MLIYETFFVLNFEFNWRNEPSKLVEFFFSISYHLLFISYHRILKYSRKCAEYSWKTWKLWKLQKHSRMVGILFWCVPHISSCPGTRRSFWGILIQNSFKLDQLLTSFIGGCSFLAVKFIKFIFLRIYRFFENLQCPKTWKNGSDHEFLKNHWNHYRIIKLKEIVCDKFLDI